MDIDHNTSILVIGDLCVDTVVSDPLSFAQVAADDRDFTQRLSLGQRVGGTAYHFAVAVRDVLSYKPTIIGCVGADPMGDYVLRSVEDQKIESWIDKSDRSPTGQTVIAFSTQDNRFMLVAEPNANADLSLPANLDEELDRFEAVWVSGLALSRPAGSVAQAVRLLLKMAQQHCIPVILDIVPHEFHTFFGSLPALLEDIGPVTCLVSELPSARRLVAQGEPGEQLSVETLAEASQEIVAHVPWCVLRYRESDDYIQGIANRNGSVSISRTPVPCNLQMPGFGDRLMCVALPVVLGKEEI